MPCFDYLSVVYLYVFCQLYKVFYTIYVSGMQSRRLFVTDNWLLRTSTYTVHIAHQSNIHLNLSSSDQYQLSNEGVGVAQYINITVQSINTRVKNFDIR